MWKLFSRKRESVKIHQDVWFVFDVFLNFFMGYIHYGILMMSREKRMGHDLKSFEIMLRGNSSSRKSIKLIKYFKIPWLMRISCIMKYMSEHKHAYDIFQVFVHVFTSLHLGAATTVKNCLLSPKEL